MTNGTTPKNNAIVLKTQSEQERISSIRVQVWKILRVHFLQEL